MSKDTLQINDIFNQGYGLSPKSVMKDKSLSIEAKAIYAYLASYSGAGITSFPSVSLVCGDLGISRQRFNKYRKQLEDAGLVTVTQIKNKGIFSHNVYTLNTVPMLRNPTTDKPTTGNATTNNNNPNINNLNNPLTPASGGDESEKPKSGHEIKNADYTVEDVVDLYNEVCGELLPRCNAINDSRIRSARKLSQLKLVSGKQPFIDGGLEAWKVYFAKAISNPFNTGNNDRAWKANFDYLMREAKALMILGI